LSIVSLYADGEFASVVITEQLILVTRKVGDFESYDGLIIENWFAPPN
jgi:tRNA(fMet)-specific endonuclease VapC